MQFGCSSRDQIEAKGLHKPVNDKEALEFEMCFVASLLYQHSAPFKSTTNESNDQVHTRAAAWR